MFAGGLSDARMAGCVLKGFGNFVIRGFRFLGFWGLGQSLLKKRVLGLGALWFKFRLRNWVEGLLRRDSQATNPRTARVLLKSEIPTVPWKSLKPKAQKVVSRFWF